MNWFLQTKSRLKITNILHCQGRRNWRDKGAHNCLLWKFKNILYSWWWRVFARRQVQCNIVQHHVVQRQGVQQQIVQHHVVQRHVIQRHVIQSHVIQSHVQRHVQSRSLELFQSTACTSVQMFILCVSFCSLIYIDFPTSLDLRSSNAKARFEPTIQLRRKKGGEFGMGKSIWK